MQKHKDGYGIGDAKVASCILWDVYPIVHPTEKEGVLVELQYGWTSGMTDEEKSNIAEDAPNECASVLTSLDQLVILRDKLNIIIERYSEHHNKTKDIAWKELEAKMPTNEEMLKLVRKDTKEN